MSTIYDLDTDQQVIELLPVDKRYSVTVAWLQGSLKSTVQFLRDILIGDYRLGSTAPAYVAGTYTKGTKVIFNKGEYISNKNGNTDAPTVAASWDLLNANFIGVNERQLYNGQKVILEYALNKWFGTTFRQPGAGASDIFLSTNSKGIPVFVSGGTEANSSASYGNHSTEFSIDAYSFGDFSNLSINVPIAVYNALDTNPANRDSIIRNFADKYVYAGITYQVVTY